MAAHRGLQRVHLALETPARFLGFLDAGVGVGQIEVLERNPQRKTDIGAPCRANIGMCLAQAQIHRRFVLDKHAAALVGEGRRLERGIRRRVAQQVVEGQLPRARGPPQLVFGVPATMHARVQEARQLRLGRHAQRVVAESPQRCVGGADGLRRPLQQALEAHEEARQAGGAGQGANVVRLPQGEPHMQREAVPLAQRRGDFEWIAEDVDAHGRLRRRAPDRQEGAQPWLLDEPRAMGIELQHDVAGQRDVSSFLLRRQPLDVKRRQTVPVAAGLEQHRVVQGADVSSFPEALLVLGATPDANILAAEVEAHQIEHTREGRSAGPVHSQHEYLHPLASSPWA